MSAAIKKVLTQTQRLETTYEGSLDTLSRLLADIRTSHRTLKVAFELNIAKGGINSIKVIEDLSLE